MAASARAASAIPELAIRWNRSRADATSPLFTRSHPFSIRAAFSEVIGGTPGAFRTPCSIRFVGGDESALAIHSSRAARLYRYLRLAESRLIAVFIMPTKFWARKRIRHYKSRRADCQLASLTGPPGDSRVLRLGPRAQGTRRLSQSQRRPRAKEARCECLGNRQPNAVDPRLIERGCSRGDAFGSAFWRAGSGWKAVIIVGPMTAVPQRSRRSASNDDVRSSASTAAARFPDRGANDVAAQFGAEGARMRLTAR